MSDMHIVSDISSDSAEPLTFAEKEVLERAVAKVVLLGGLVGVSTEQMILLLDSGLTMRELLEYLGTRTTQLVGKQAPLAVSGEGQEGD